eukprot:TRINITY_DN8762_c0_g1_i10.p3 TRINITY_DN8762_c0_g1~~TRINITY_DN8762_c0_g1_i10.p3  ORF type:complete len:181 (-),score=62.95 TRINITY_DN8762_c0_g1_i10:285-827(-)
MRLTLNNKLRKINNNNTFILALQKNYLVIFFFFFFFFFLMIRRPPRSTHCISSAASDVYKRQYQRRVHGDRIKLKGNQKRKRKRSKKKTKIKIKQIKINSQEYCKINGNNYWQGQERQGIGIIQENQSQNYYFLQKPIKYRKNHKIINRKCQENRKCQSQRSSENASQIFKNYLQKNTLW